MVRKFGALTLALVAGLFAISTINAADEKLTSIEDIMKKVPNKGMKKGLAAKAIDAAGEGKWEDAQKMGAELKTHGETLAKHKAPKGEQASWEKLSKAFSEQMTAIEKGAKDKDADAMKKAAGEFGKSCKACHDAHR
jgi:cytochrome c556